jgi:hypothetical protein
MARRNVAGLVEQASDDIQGDPTMKRGRGVAGMMGVEQEIPPTSAQAQGSISIQAHSSAKPHLEVTPIGGKGKRTKDLDENGRISRSYRVNAELARQFDLLAAHQARYMYEALEEAMADYLAKYGW